MQTKTKNKLLLCVKEMYYIRDILNLGVCDDLSARMFGIYVAMRMDDFRKLMPNVPESNPNSSYYQAHKDTYVNEYEDIRNKLGGHFQTIHADTDNIFADVMARNILYQNIEYEKLMSLIEDTKIIYQIATCNMDVEPVLGLQYQSDRDAIKNVLSSFNEDSITKISLDSLATSRPNTTSVVLGCRGGQQLQRLMTLELLLDRVSACTRLSLQDSNVLRLFKRMLCCWTVNYMDNIFTRAVVSTAPQYDPALDLQLTDGLTDDQEVAHIQNVFKEYKEEHVSYTVIDGLRQVRNKMCAHLDSAADVSDMNSILDAVNTADVFDAFGDMVCFRKSLSVKIKSLRFVLPDTAFPIYDSEVVNPGLKAFYGQSVSPSHDTMSVSMSLIDAFDAIHKDDVIKMGLAEHRITSALLEPADSNDFIEATRLMKDAFLKEGMTYREAEKLSVLLQVKNYNMSDMLTLILDIIVPFSEVRNVDAHKFLLWPFCNFAHYDQEGRMAGFIDCLKKSPHNVHKLYVSALMIHAAFAEINDPYMKQNPQLDKRIVDYITTISNPALSLACSITLASHWHFHRILCSHVKLYSNISHAIDRLTVDALLNYMQGSDTKDIEKGRVLLENSSYSQLLYLLLKNPLSEADRSVFACLITDSLLCGVEDPNERMFHSLCFEEVGYTNRAMTCLDALCRELNVKEMYITYYNFLKRHSEFEPKAHEIADLLNKEFGITENEINS